MIKTLLTVGLLSAVAHACDEAKFEQCFVDTPVCDHRDCTCFDTLIPCVEKQSGCVDKYQLLPLLFDDQRLYCPKDINGCDQDALDACIKAHNNGCEKRQTCACFDALEVCYMTHPECDIESKVDGVRLKKSFLTPACPACDQDEYDDLIKCLKATSDCHTKATGAKDQHCACHDAQLACFEAHSDEKCPIGAKAATKVKKIKAARCNAPNPNCDKIQECFDAIEACKTAEKPDESCECITAKSDCYDNVICDSALASEVAAAVLTDRVCSKPDSCSGEVKECPDGTVVVKRPPFCKFPACPTETNTNKDTPAQTTSAGGATTTAVAEPATGNTVITSLAVVMATMIALIV